MSTIPHAPQPCDIDSLLVGSQGQPLLQPGFHCSHMNVPCWASVRAGPSALASVISFTTWS